MSVLIDLSEELKAYAAGYIALQITDVNWPGDVPNVDNLVSFKVKAWNGFTHLAFPVHPPGSVVSPPGHRTLGSIDYSIPFELYRKGAMHVRKLALKIKGSPYSDVSLTEHGVYSDQIISTEKSIDAWTMKEFGPFWVKLKSSSDEEVNIFSINIDHFDLTWDHQLIDQTGSTETKASYAVEIHPR